MHIPLCLQLVSITEIHVTYYNCVLDFDPKAYPQALTEECDLLESQKSLPGTQNLNMNAL